MLSRLNRLKSGLFSKKQEASSTREISSNIVSNTIENSNSKNSIVGSILNGIRTRFSSLLHPNKSEFESLQTETVEPAIYDSIVPGEDDFCDVEVSEQGDNLSENINCDPSDIEELRLETPEFDPSNFDVNPNSLNLPKVNEVTSEITPQVKLNTPIRHESGNIIQGRISILESNRKPLLKILSIKQKSDLGKFILSLPDHSFKAQKISRLSIELINLLKRNSNDLSLDHVNLINFIFSFLGNALNVNNFSESQTANYISAFLNGKFIPTENYINFVATLNDLNVEEFTDEKISELRAKLINEDYSSIEVLAYYLSLKDAMDFTPEESKVMNKLLMYGSMNVDVDESLKSRVFEYILFLKDKYSTLPDHNGNNDLLMQHLNLENVTEIGLLSNSFNTYKSIFTSKPTEIACEQNEIRLNSDKEEQELKKSRTDMLRTLKSRSEDLVQKGIDDYIDKIVQVKSVETKSIGDLGIDYFLKPENFHEIFNLPLERIIDSDNRAVDMSTGGSVFEYCIWSKGKNNPNQDCAIAFDQGMVLCDGAGSAENSELVSAFFSNFIYTHREKISSVINLIYFNEAQLKQFLSDVLAYASLEFKRLYPNLSNGRSYSTFSMVFKPLSDDVTSKNMISFTIGDSPVINGEQYVSGHTDIIDKAYDPIDLYKLLEVLKKQNKDPRSAFNFVSLKKHIKQVYPRISDDIFSGDWYLNLENLKLLIDKYDLLTICKKMLRNAISTCVPRFVKKQDSNSLSDLSTRYFEESNLNVFQFDPNNPVTICSDGLSDNFSTTGVLDVSLTPVDEVNALDLANSSIDRSDINAMFGYKVDDATVVRMDLKPEFMDLAKESMDLVKRFLEEEEREGLISLDSILGSLSQSSSTNSEAQNSEELLHELIKLNTEEELIANASYAPSKPEESYSETQVFERPSGFALLKSKVGSWFKRSISKSDATEESMVTRKGSWFERLKSKLLTINYAQSLQKFLTYKTVAVFSIGILTYLLKDADLASQLFQSLDGFVSFDQSESTFGGEGGNSNSPVELQEGVQGSLVQTQMTGGSQPADSLKVVDTNLPETYDVNQDPIIQHTANDFSSRINNLVLEKSDATDSVISLPENNDGLNENNSLPGLQDSDSSSSEVTKQEDSFKLEDEIEIENQMQVESKHFLNVNCDASSDTLAENGVDSLNPENANINVNETYSVNLNDEDSTLLQRDDTGRVIGRLREGERFQFTGYTHTVSANNATDDILYAEAKTSDGKTFWIARAYAKQV